MESGFPAKREGRNPIKKGADLHRFSLHNPEVLGGSLKKKSRFLKKSGTHMGSPDTQQYNHSPNQPARGLLFDAGCGSSGPVSLFEGGG